jgi:endonuclease/exonuclease/phosphatase (EEP) superfamily protein YafD
MGDEEIQLLGLYIEPGDTKVTRGRVDKAVAIIQDMIRQDRDARIVVGGDLNAQLNNLQDRLDRLGFRPGITPGTATQRDGGMLDQVWARNLQLTNVMVSEYVDNGVSDHLCLKATVSMPTYTGNRDPDGK